MTTRPDKPKRWRPRFSVRTLVVVVTLACAYAACWGPTKKWGVEDVSLANYLPDSDLPDYVEQEVLAALMLFDDQRAIAPLIVRTDTNTTSSDADYWSGHGYGYRRYWFWFFGYVVKLHERQDKLTTPTSGKWEVN